MRVEPQLWNEVQEILYQRIFGLFSPIKPLVVENNPYEYDEILEQTLLANVQQIVYLIMNITGNADNTFSPLELEVLVLGFCFVFRDRISYIALLS